MAVFIELTTDKFEDVFREKTDLKRSENGTASHAGIGRVRRPLRGLEIKDDTYAVMRVMRADGSEISLIDSSSATGTSSRYANFILQSVQEARMEKHQIVETFGEPYIFFFGEAPRFLDVSAVLIDSQDFNWYAEFWENYQTHLRGTRLVEQGARTYLFYEDNIVEGYMLNASAQKVADQPLMVQLTFRLYLTNYSNVSFVGNPSFPVRSSVQLPPGVDLTSADISSVGLSAASAADDSYLQNAADEQAALGVAQQRAGFGGTGMLSDALRKGASSAYGAFLENAYGTALALSEMKRTRPIRGLIEDNYDEFTKPKQTSASRPIKPKYSALPVSMPQAVTQAVRSCGGNVNNPTALAHLGLSVSFRASIGVSLRAGVSASASFGARAGFSAGSTAGAGLNSGLGFTAGYTAAAGVSLSSNGLSSYSRTSSYAGTPADVYGNGVPIQGGLSQGTGIGGGVPYGVAGSTGPDGRAGSLPTYAAGASYSSDRGAQSYSGWVPGASGNGPSVDVGGAPSAFSTVAAPGTFSGTYSKAFSFGPDGVSTSEKKTGIFA